MYSNPTVTQLSVTGGAGKKEGLKTADGQMVCKLETTEKGSRFISFKKLIQFVKNIKSKGHKAPLRSENREIGKASDLAALRVGPEGNPGGP